MMDVVTSQNHFNKKGNKENTQPAHGSKSFIKRDKTTVAPFQLKINEKQETLSKPAPLKIKTKQVDTRSNKALKKMDTVQKDKKEAVSVNVKMIAADVAKPPAAMPSRSAPGMYKGKIVQSKIGSIWKASAAVGGEEPKLSATESQRIGNVTKSRSRSVSDLPRCGTQKPGSRSVLIRPPVSCHPARTVPLTLARTSSRNTTVAPTKANGSQTSKTNISVTDKVIKPSVSSKPSQYRLTMETTEQKRAKLAEWLASKGKTLKRPPMTTSAPPKTKVSAKPRVEHGPRSHVQPQPALESKRKIKQAHKPDSAATAHCADTQEVQFTAHRQTPELLENSDEDVLMDDIVVNLCSVLEAMATPSTCNGDLEQETNSVEMKDDKPKEEECKKEKVQNEIMEPFGQQESEEVKNESQESQEVETQEEEDEVEGNNKVVSTPHVQNASVVKYSVKTTPYLQSVKKTIEGESCTSKKKSNIKDLKFLTPVRRSCRIQRKSSHLPSMLVDHDPCVSSLAELVKLDDDTNAYIYRKNPALMEDLPDQC